MEKQRKTDSLPRKLLNVISRFNESDRKIRTFGTDTPLHLSEIHLIEFIGGHPDLYVSEIAREKKVTKGAISQTLRRLERKNLIRKRPDAGNHTRVVVSLTEAGWTAYREHEKFHQEIAEKVAACVRGKTEQEKNAIGDFLSRLERLL